MGVAWWHAVHHATNLQSFFADEGPPTRTAPSLDDLDHVLGK